MVGKLYFVVALLAVVVSLALVAGCGGGGGSSSSGTGTLRVSLMDAPLDAEKIYVDITSIQAHSVSDGWITVKQYTTPLHVNLLDYSSVGSSLMLAETPFKAGKYTMVRLMVSAASIVIGGQTYDVDITNVTSTGVKCNGEFTVNDGQLIALILDFNAGKSFVNNPKGSTNFKLHPVMAMSPVNIATEVTGTVEVLDNTQTKVEIPDGTVVDVYTKDHVGDADYLINGAIVESDGTFKIGMIPQGTYDFRVTVGTTTVDMLSKAVAPPTTDLGKISVQLP